MLLALSTPILAETPISENCAFENVRCVGPEQEYNTTTSIEGAFDLAVKSAKLGDTMLITNETFIALMKVN